MVVTPSITESGAHSLVQVVTTAIYIEGDETSWGVISKKLLCVPQSKLLILGMVIPPFIGIPEILIMGI